MTQYVGSQQLCCSDAIAVTVPLQIQVDAVLLVIMPTVLDVEMQNKVAAFYLVLEAHCEYQQANNVAEPCT